jgi:hypothetical protein
MRHLLCVFLYISMLFSVLQAQQIMQQTLTIPFEIDNNTTSTYHEVVDFYKALGASSPLVSVSNFGMTDSGYPLQEVVIAANNDFTPEQSRAAGKSILFINNGIHPGEPDGIDASMLLAKEIVTDVDLVLILEKVTIVIIPVYNIGGILNRSSTSRANQEGPSAYGFRGNAKNYDLNRDFVKCDAKNSVSFNAFFHKWDPDVQVDTHTSNGADYQYTMTLIATQKDKLHPELSSILTQNMLPFLYDEMAKANWEMIPYVNADETPDDGVYGFLDHSRYSSGYAAMHHTISFMPETHMLKPYNDRVWSTHAFLKTTLMYMHNHGQVVASIRSKIKEQIKTQDAHHLQYVLDKSNVEKLSFKGYTAKYKPSLVSGKDRLYYDRNAPFTKDIPFFNTYTPSLTVVKPTAYIIPKAYDAIIDKMKNNGVKVDVLQEDALFDVEMYKIDNYTTTKSAYEGHYLHSKVNVTTISTQKSFSKGDFIIYTHQAANRYIIETLEPQGVDSWFAWNFFDGILMQKEHFSAYVFEDLAADILQNDPALQQLLYEKKQSDPAFKDDGDAQLEFVYRHSPYYEPTHNLYPVARLIK